MSDKFCSSSADLDSWVSNFQMLDKDNDGQVSLADIEGMITTTGDKLGVQEAQELIDIADTDGDGLMSLDEFVALMQRGLVTVCAISYTAPRTLLTAIRSACLLTSTHPFLSVCTPVSLPVYPTGGRRHGRSVVGSGSSSWSEGQAAAKALSARKSSTARGRFTCRLATCCGLR